MLLPNIEPNTHSPNDWNKRLSNSYVYASVDNGATNKVVFVKAVSEILGTSLEDYQNATVIYKDHQTQAQQCNASKFGVESFRPEVGIYNLDKFPVFITHLPFRQWHFGCTSESIAIKRLSGIGWNVSMREYEYLFNPEYPTLGDAVDLLKGKKKKHIALSPYVSLLASGTKVDRFVLLYKFVPMASINSGMWFPSPSGLALEKVALEYKDVIMELLAK